MRFSLIKLSINATTLPTIGCKSHHTAPGAAPLINTVKSLSITQTSEPPQGTNQELLRARAEIRAFYALTAEQQAQKSGKGLQAECLNEESRRERLEQVEWRGVYEPERGQQAAASDSNTSQIVEGHISFEYQKKLIDIESAIKSFHRERYKAIIGAEELRKKLQITRNPKRKEMLEKEIEQQLERARQAQRRADEEDKKAEALLKKMDSQDAHNARAPLEAVENVEPRESLLLRGEPSPLEEEEKRCTLEMMRALGLAPQYTPGFSVPDPSRSNSVKDLMQNGITGQADRIIAKQRKIIRDNLKELETDPQGMIRAWKGLREEVLKAHEKGERHHLSGYISLDPNITDEEILQDYRKGKKADVNLGRAHFNNLIQAFQTECALQKINEMKEEKKPRP